MRNDAQSDGEMNADGILVRGTRGLLTHQGRVVEAQMLHEPMHEGPMVMFVVARPRLARRSRSKPRRSRERGREHGPRPHTNDKVENNVLLHRGTIGASTAAEMASLRTHWINPSTAPTTTIKDIST